MVVPTHHNKNWKCSSIYGARETDKTWRDTGVIVSYGTQHTVRTGESLGMSIWDTTVFTTALLMQTTQPVADLQKQDGIIIVVFHSAYLSSFSNRDKKIDTNCLHSTWLNTKRMYNNTWVKKYSSKHHDVRTGDYLLSFCYVVETNK